MKIERALRSRQALVACGLFVLVVCAVGCSDDEPVSFEQPAFRVIETEDEFMGAFRELHENMDLDWYIELLDPGFRLHLNESTVAEHDLAADHLVYADDVRSTRNQFSGESPGELIPGINRIIVANLVGLDAWVDTDDERFPGARSRAYIVEFILETGSGVTRQDIRIEGRMDFFLARNTDKVTTSIPPRDIDSAYRLVGQVDHTAAKAAESAAWGEMKVLFLGDDQAGD